MANSSTFVFFPLLLISFFFFFFATAMGGYPEKVHLHFYSVNLTMATVATLNNTRTGFGNLSVLDSALAEAPDARAKAFGRVQGMAVGASLSNDGLLTTLNFVFTGGKYNGSSLAVYGRELVGTPAERTIVGGSGQFRLARGFVESKIYSATGTAIVVDFNCYILVHKH